MRTILFPFRLTPEKDHLNRVRIHPNLEQIDLNRQQIHPNPEPIQLNLGDNNIHSEKIQLNDKLVRSDLE